MNDMEIRVYLEEADVRKDFFDCKENNLKCPFCQQELREIYCYNVVMGYLCPNPDCKKAEKLKGNAEFWQELIRTRKALDVAKDTFNWIDETYRTGQETEAEIWGKVQLAAQEITATLENKNGNC